jgi:KUP system potassium uptake protein
VDLSFVAANLTKVADGGWVPLAAAALVFTLMESWRVGRSAMFAQLERDSVPVAPFIASIAGEARVPGTAVYLSRREDIIPVSILHNVKHYHVLHERNVILHVETEQVPRVQATGGASVTDLGHGFYRIVLLYGFMQQPDIPRELERCSLDGQGFDMMQTSFFLSRVSVVGSAAGERHLYPLVRRLFSWMQRNAADTTEFFRIPPNRIVELGARIEL